MSIAASQYSEFRASLANCRKVFTVLDEEDFIVFKVGEHDVIPFWSSRRRLDRIQRQHPKYAKWSIAEISLDSFLKCLTDCEEQGILIGVNWAGSRLIGFDVEAKSVRDALGALSK